jgi:subtilisin family serine protease
MSSHATKEIAARGFAPMIVVLDAAIADRASTARAAAGDVEAGGRNAHRAPKLATLARCFLDDRPDEWSELAREALAGHYSLSTAEREGLRRRPKTPTLPPAVRYYPNLGIMYGSVDRDGLAALKRAPGVRAVASAPAFSLIRPRYKTAVAARKGIPWGIRAMRAERLWADGLTGHGVIVGHLDTGVDGRHPALRDAIRYFAEFDDLGQLVRPTPRPYDSDDHGTHTAATICGRPVRGFHVGVAPGAKLASAMVIEDGDVVARVLGGMDWAIGKKARIVSISLGFRGWHDDFQVLVRVLRERGVLPVVAVGNEGPGRSRSPGNYPEVCSVGAHDNARAVAYFSSSQHFHRKASPVVPDLVAPGVNIVSAKPGHGWQAMDGSSMATPHVAGLCALLMEARPKRTIDEVETAILESCKLAPRMRAERAGRGMPDAKVALSLL